MVRAISENRFHEHFKPQLLPDGNLMEHADTLAYPVERVWTIIEDDYGRNWYATPGYHIVNRLGYVVTEVPWSDAGRIALYSGR